MKKMLLSIAVMITISNGLSNEPSASKLQAIKAALAPQRAAKQDMLKAAADQTYQSNQQKMAAFTAQLQALVGTKNEESARAAIITSSQYQQTLSALKEYYATILQPKAAALQQSMVRK
jgi:hypothetical protein